MWRKTLRRMSTVSQVWNLRPPVSQIRSMRLPPMRSTVFSSTREPALLPTAAMPQMPQSLTWLRRMMWWPVSGAGSPPVRCHVSLPTSMPRALAQRTSLSSMIQWWPRVALTRARWGTGMTSAACSKWNPETRM